MLDSEAYLSAVHDDKDGLIASSSEIYSGPHRADVWARDPDGSITPIWKQDDGSMFLLPFLNRMTVTL